MTTEPLNDFFHDCPWLHIPPHRQAIIMEEPQIPPGRLLGGTSKEGKMSKLVALAAKRRKEKESQKSSSGDNTSESADYTERLRQLQVSQPGRTTKQTKSDERLDEKHHVEETLDTEDDSEATQAPEHNLPEAGLVQSLRHPPSAFATVLTQPSNEGPPATYALLPDQIQSAKSTFDFSQPSPDDVFRRAQGSK